MSEIYLQPEHQLPARNTIRHVIWIVHVIIIADSCLIIQVHYITSEDS